MEELTKDKVLNIKTFGVLEFRLGEEEFSLGGVTAGKVVQLFLLLALAGERGISRVTLQDYLYDRSSADAANGLRILSCRLRKQLTESELPDGRYINNRKGRYYLGDSVDVRIDADVMTRNWKMAQQEEDQGKRAELLEAACRIYEGEFLPSMSGEFWVESMRSRYQDLYFECLRAVYGLLSEMGEYERALALTEDAARLYPSMEEWVAFRIELLAKMNRYKEMKQVYNQAVKYFLEKVGQPLNDFVRHRFEKLSERACSVSERVDDTCKMLMEETQEKQAYCCAFPGFVDCFQMQLRGPSEKGDQTSLLICSIYDRRNRGSRSDSWTEKYISELCEILNETLEQGDVYTRRHPSQALILTRNNGPELKKKIVGRFREKSNRKAAVSVWCKPLSAMKKLSEKK